MRDRYLSAPTRDRAIAAAGVALVHLAIGYLLITGLAPELIRHAADSLQTFDLVAPPPPPPPPPEIPARTAADARRNGAAAPANRDAKPTNIVAPPIALPVPSPVIAAPVAALDAAPEAGVAPLPGPGTGGGGVGQGTGSGATGNGQGAGGAGTFAYKIAGRIYDRDYPKSAVRAGIGGTVWVRYTVTVKGRAEDCRVTRSSGNADLDAVTCKLVTKRFRYRPGTNAAGRPIASVIEEDHNWVIGPDDGTEDGGD